MAKFSTDKVVKLQGKEYVLFEGLLEVAHEHCHLQSISTNLIQLPTQESPFCIVQATVTTDKGESFQGLGDASPSNVNKMIVPHMIRMAETRAVARALRFLTGFGTAFEELGELNEQPQETNKKPVQSASTPSKPQSPAPKQNYVQKAVEKFIEQEKGDPVKEAVEMMTEEDIRAVFGDDVEVVFEDRNLNEEEIQAVTKKINATGAFNNDKEIMKNNYGSLYKMIRDELSIQVKSKNDIPSIQVSDYDRLIDWLSSKKDYFKKAA